MKPKIRRVTPYLFGVRCNPAYACESREIIEYGETPSAAYGAWYAAVPKTAVGRMVKRAGNWLADVLMG